MIYGQKQRHKVFEEDTDFFKPSPRAIYGRMVLIIVSPLWALQQSLIFSLKSEQNDKQKETQKGIESF